MKGACSNLTDDVFNWITRLSVACCVIWTLGSCALISGKDEQTESGDQIEKTEKEELPPPCPALPAKELEREALELLDAGDVLAARTRLECALESSPGSYKASNLLKQLDADPLETLGSEYFWYTVKSNETLSKIAEQHLGSSLKFVILARYNDIDVPANLAAGQNIKIPGKPAPESTVLPPERIAPSAGQLRDLALKMEQQDKLGEAFELMKGALAENPELDNGQEDLARIKKGFLLKLEEAAYEAELSGDPKKAAEIWRRVLSIDPGNIPAQLALKRLTE